jgi:hypothetical protein
MAIALGHNLLGKEILLLAGKDAILFQSEPVEIFAVSASMERMAAPGTPKK